jgi:hypothetical protein
MRSKNHMRAVRYRQLALPEADKGKADLLHQIADEAEQGLLCTVDRLIPRTHPKVQNWTDKQEDSLRAWPFALIQIRGFVLDANSASRAISGTDDVATIDHHANDTGATAPRTISVAIGGPGNDSFVFHQGQSAAAASDANSTDTVELFYATNNSPSTELPNVMTGLSQFFFRGTK